MLYLNGIPYPKEVVSSTINTELIDLRDSLREIPTNKELFHKKKEIAFREIYHMTFPVAIDEDDDYEFLLSPDSWTHNGVFAFAVRDENMVRIMVDQLIYCKEEGRHLLTNTRINEVYISYKEIESIVRDVTNAIRDTRR